jgi:pimeloyl-ACP methyl ester carboxylesterase
MTSRLVLALALAACGHAAPSPAQAAAPSSQAAAPSPRVAAPASAASAAFAVTVTGHGPPIVLIPGLASSGDVWNGTVAHVRDHHTCHVLTLAGFAGQPRVPAPMLATVRDALAAYITEHHLDHPVIVGHSLGGFLALDLAEHHPDLVGRLFIVDSLPFLPAAFDPSATAESGAKMGPQFRAHLAGLNATQRRAMVDTMVTAPADQALVASWGDRSDPTAVADAFVELMSTDLRPGLSAIHVPTFVIGTYRGMPAKREDVQKVFDDQYAGLRGAKITLAETARHFVMLDDPALVYAELDRFLAAR